VGYRKIHTAIPGDTTKTQPQELVLVFAPDTGDSTELLVGVILEMRTFVSSVLAPKLNQLSGQQFGLAVFETGSPMPAYATATFALQESAERTKLWVMPNYFLAIKSTANTIEDLAWQRRFSDLAVTIFLNICLVFGVWILYRNVNKETQLAHMKSDFVSNVSHELRTPLSMIRMFAETLELNRVKTEEKKLEYYGIIRQESERMTHLVNNILNFSKMEAGQAQLLLKEEDLNAMVKKVIDNYRFHLINHGFAVQEEFGETLPQIRANEQAVAEAIINLLENAVKYSGENKQVCITTGRENGRVYVKITDKGIGIPQDKQQYIFDKFYRVSNGLVHNTRGSGLGLTLVKHIISEHRGEVTVKSAPGAGSSFTLWFPEIQEKK
jgi:two-component system phosphate regulon sensor histidine kinase PhoR